MQTGIFIPLIGVRTYRITKQSHAYLYRTISSGTPHDPIVTAVAVTTEDMAVTWITPAADGNPTSYNISITNRSDPVKVNHTGPSEYTHIFRGLRSDTMYTVLLVAINCAGVSNTTEIFQRTCKYFNVDSWAMFHPLEHCPKLMYEFHEVNRYLDIIISFVKRQNPRRETLLWLFTYQTIQSH